MPLGLIVGDGAREGQPAFEGWANGGGPAGPRARARGALLVHQAAPHPQHRVDHGRRALRGGTPLSALARRDEELPAVLGIRRGPAARGQLRTQVSIRRLAAGGEIPERTARRAAEPAAKRGLPVLRHADGRSRHPPVEVGPVESGQRQALERRTRRGGGGGGGG